MSREPDKRSVIVVDASPIFGGAQRSLLTTLSGMVDKDVELVVVAGSSRLMDELRSRSIPAVPFPFKLWTRNLYGLMNAATDILQFRGFLSGLGKPEEMVYYANGIQSGLLLSLSLPKSAKLVVHHRDIRCPGFALKKVMKRANKTIVLTAYMAEVLAERLGRGIGERVTPVYNAFDFDELKMLSEEKTDAELASERILVTFVADLVPWKRHDLFIDAMARAAEKETALRGMIIGGARDQAGERYRLSLENQIRSLGAESVVELVGAVANPLPLIRQSHAMCALSDQEPFGRTVIEAASVGTPMVVRQPGGPAELAGDLPAVEVVDDDVDSIAEAILKMAKEPRYDVTDTWKQQFSVETQCNTIFEMLND